MPASVIVCLACALRLLSLKTKAPLTTPLERGVKLMGKVHEAPGASATTFEECAWATLHAEAALPFQVKFGEMLGLLPVAGAGMTRLSFPIL